MQKIILFLLLFLSAVNLSGQNSGKSTGGGSSNSGSVDSNREPKNLNTYGSGHFLEGEMIDCVTKNAISDDTELILMTEDSVKIPDVMVLTNIQEKDKSNSFLVEIPKSGNYILCFTNSLYHTLYMPVKVQFKDDEHLKNIGKIEMKRKSMAESDHVLDEVVVKGTKLKFYFDNDTLIYNADAFITQKGFILNDILRKMPGVVVEGNGEIYANGKRVDVLLLDGKNFFDGDRKTILDNIPAFMVKDVKVYDTQKDSISVAESDDEPQGHIMDVTLKPDYHDVALGNVDVGGGTDKRYNVKLFGLKHNDFGRLSFTVNGNNVNKIECLGSNGEVTYAYPVDHDEIVRDNVSLKYDIRDKKRNFSAGGDVEYGYQDQNTKEAGIQHMMIDDADVNRYYVNNFHWYNNDVKTNHRLKFFEQSPYSFTLMPSLRFSRSRQNGKIVESSFSKDVTDMLGENWKDSIKSDEIGKTMLDYGQNRAIEDKSMRRDEMDFKVGLSKHHAISDTGISLSLDAYVNYRYNERNGMGISQYDYLQETPYRKQMRNYYNYQDGNVLENYVSVSFNYLMGRNHSMSLGYSLKNIREDSERSYYALHDLNGMGMEYSLDNPPQADVLASVKEQANSYSDVAHNNFHLIKWEYRYQKDGAHLSVNVPFRMEYYKYAYTQANIDTLVRRKLIMPDVSVSIGKEWKGERRNSVSCNLYYKLTNSTPRMLDLVNRYNDINPLHTQKGNPELKNPIRHNFSGNIDLRKGIDYHGLGLSYVLSKNRIVSSQLLDMKTGALTIMPQNVSCEKSFSFNVSNKVYVLKNMFNVFNEFAFSQDILKSFVDTDQSKLLEEKNIQNLGIGEKFGVGFTSRNTKYIASCSGYIECHKTKSDTKTDGNSSISEYGVKFDTAIECPWDIRLKSNVTTVNRRGYDVDKDNNMELIWNASLAKSFTDNMTLSLECFDILNQRKLIRQYVRGYSRDEIQSNGIRRYVMLRFVYRLNSSKKQGNRGERLWNVG